MKKKFEHSEDDLGCKLKCQDCGNNNLHHEKIEVFERGEDEEKGLHITTENGTARIDTDLSDNPSSRRDGIKIHFICENCKTKTVLSIFQHKGNTFFDII